MKLLRMKDLKKQYDLPRTTVDYWRSEGLFPAPLKIGKRSIVWRQTTIEEWLDSHQEAALAEAPAQSGKVSNSE